MKRTYPVIPLVAEASTSEALGYPGELIDNWQEVAIARLGELVNSNRALAVFMDTCTRCGACADKCHYGIGTQDPNNMPVARQELLRSVWRRYHTFFGRHLPWLVGARELDRTMLDDWYRYFHQCSECRRCAVFCPKGIDTTEVTMAGREILATVGLGQRYSQTIVEKAGRLGNNLGMKPAAIANVLENLEEDLADELDEQEWGGPVRLPLDDATADVLVVVPSADLFAEPHVDGLLGLARILHVAGVRWTLSSDASEAANFGLFAGNLGHERDLASRLVSAVRTLGTRRLVIGECGHAWRVAGARLEALVRQMPEHQGVLLADLLDAARAEHVCELTHELWAAGRITLDASRNAGKVVSYHDSCNIARGAAMGETAEGAFALPRALLRSSVERFVEMPRGTTHRETFCCGGGGGMLADDLMDVRVKGALPRAHALARVVDSDQVTHLAAICAICKTQLSTVLPLSDVGVALDAIDVVSLHALVGDAVVPPNLRVS